MEQNSETNFDSEKPFRPGLNGKTVLTLGQIEDILNAPYETVVQRDQEFQMIVNVRDKESVLDKVEKIEELHPNLPVMGFEHWQLISEKGGYTVLHVQPGKGINFRPMISYEENPNLLCVGEGDLKFKD
jgi:hypothetical protein